MSKKNGKFMPCAECKKETYFSLSRLTRPRTNYFCSPKCRYLWSRALESTAVARFWTKVNKTAQCWLWTGATLKTGYGVFDAGTGRANKHTEYAHRFAMELAGYPL